MRKFFIIIAFILLVPTSVHAAQYVDVPQESEAYEAIQELSKKGIIQGYEDQTFRPTQSIQRGEAMLFITRSIEVHQLPYRIKNRSLMYFQDVPIQSKYYVPLTKLQAIGATDGYEDKTYRLQHSVQRDQFLKMVSISFQLGDIDAIEGEHWGVQYAQQFEHLQLMYPPIMEDLQRPITREEAAQLLYNVLRYTEQSDRSLLGQQQMKLPNLQSRHTYEKQRKAYDTYMNQDSSAVYRVEPRLTAPYYVGALRDEYKHNALRTLQYVRAVAGLTNELTLNDDYTEEAQAAAFLLALNDEGLSHEPLNLHNLPLPLYNIGLNGASSSNIAYGYEDVRESILYGYMMDADAVNRRDVGHRRWLICPCLNKVGIGQATSLKGNRTYSAVKVFEHYAPPYAGPMPKYVTWPSAGAFPIDLFIPDEFEQTLPWSISLSSTIYAEPFYDEVEVQLHRLRDQRTFTFSSSQSDGYFNVNNESYGKAGATIIFQPDAEQLYPVANSEVFEVNVRGIRRTNGSLTSLKYHTILYE